MSDKLQNLLLSSQTGKCQASQPNSGPDSSHADISRLLEELTSRVPEGQQNGELPWPLGAESDASAPAEPIRMAQAKSEDAKGDNIQSMIENGDETKQLRDRIESTVVEFYRKQLEDSRGAAKFYERQAKRGETECEINKQTLQQQQYRSLSRCSNGSSSNGRNSSIGDHCFLEPLDWVDCATNSSGASSVSPNYNLLGRLSRRLRLLESPSDSGVESGEENGCHSALGFFAANNLSSRADTPADASTTSGSACVSPVNGGCGHEQRNLNLTRNLPLTTSRPASALSERLQVSCDHALNRKRSRSPSPQPRAQSSTPSAPSRGQFEDMPMLKRALQAPPLIDPGTLMDETYRYHKKFRATQRRENTTNSSPSEQNVVCSTSSSSPANSVDRRRLVSSGEQAQASLSPSDCAVDCPPNKQTNSRQLNKSLADMHSTLLHKLSQPSNLQLSQQLKYEDLINQIVANEQLGFCRRPIEAQQNSTIERATFLPATNLTPERSGSDQHQAVSSARPSVTKTTQGHQHQALPKLQILGSLSHHLVDEDYIAKRLMNSGAYLHHQQQHSMCARNQTSATARNSDQNVTTKLNGDQRSHSMCPSSSSPSPNSSMTTQSPSPTLSTCPELGPGADSQQQQRQLFDRLSSNAHQVDRRVCEAHKNDLNNQLAVNFGAQRCAILPMRADCIQYVNNRDWNVAQRQQYHVGLASDFPASDEMLLAADLTKNKLELTSASLLSQPIDLSKK